MAKTERDTLPDWLEPELATPHPGPVLRPRMAQRPLPRAGLSPRGAGGGAARLVCSTAGVTGAAAASGTGSAVALAADSPTVGESAAASAGTEAPCSPRRPN